jgi:tetratricopeptide (TPR) repeat protein
MGLTLILASCSKTKFSGFRQYTTNFVSYYNTYFNIKQLYKVGYRESVYDKQENTTEIISLFEYENDPQFFESTAQFKGTTVKVTKLLSRRPYNKWMDDAVLIEGKIRYLKGDLDSSIQLLSYLVDYYPKGYIAGHLPGGKLKGFDDMVRQAIRKKEPIHQPKFKFKFARNEGIIWLAKAFIKKGSYDRALNLIYMAEADMGFPVEYRKDLLKVKTMLSIDKKEYSKANEYLNLLIDEHKLSKKEIGRVYFILGQINEKEKKYSQARNYFEKALGAKLKNDLEFEAKLRMLTYSAEGGESTLAELKKMLNKGKYAHSIDKIYFAIGNVLIEKNKTDEALENYRKSIANAKNPNQKFVVYERVGSLFYEKTNYVLSAQYYDSAQRVLPQNYPNKKDFLKKVEALNRLLVQYNIYKSKDSILELAALGPEKAKAKIEKEIKKAYEKEKANELFLESQTLNKQTVASTQIGGGQARQWYFSSRENVDKGKILFQKKWGKLVLKDNWHRSAGGENVNSMAGSAAESKVGANINEEMSTDIVAEVEASKLPFSAEAKAPVIKEVQSALVNMARIYHYEIKDIKKAIETYELLFKKYGTSLENEDEHLYALYRLYLENEDAITAEDIKSKLIAKYPDSKYSLYALNPNAKTQDEKSDLAVAKQYKEAYSKYQKTFYTEAMDICNSMIEQYPEHKLIPKVKLLRAFIFSYSYNSAEYVMALEDIIAKHKDADEAKAAKEFLDLHLKLKANTKESKPSESISKESQESVVINKESVSISSTDPIAVQTEQKTISNVKEVSKETKQETAPPPAKEEFKARTSATTIESENKKKTEDGLQIVNYVYKPAAKHTILFKMAADLKETTAKNIVDVYLRTNFKSAGYKSETLEVGSHRYLIISGFKNLQSAIDFYPNMQTDVLVQKLNYSAEKFYISSENLDILYISSGWEQYLSFYEKNYK